MSENLLSEKSPDTALEYDDMSLLLMVLLCHSMWSCMLFTKLAFFSFDIMEVQLSAWTLECLGAIMNEGFQDP